MNAADYYGLDELKYACNGFIQVIIKINVIEEKSGSDQINSSEAV